MQGVREDEAGNACRGGGETADRGMGTKRPGANMPMNMPTGQARAAKERCNGMVGKSLGCKEKQCVRHGDSEVGVEAGGHCIKDKAQK